jgi:hypothetical protein
MQTCCTDIDLLHWEPNILRDAAFASQTLMSGTCDLAGSALTISSGSFITSNIEADQVIVLSGSIAGSFPIVSVNSATSLTISTLYDKLFPDSGNPAATPVGTGSGLSFVIRTFWPQRRVISEILQQAAGIIPGEIRTAGASIMNTEALRRPCLLGTLNLIYSALAAVADDPKELNVRADLYQRLYRRALRSTLVELDLNGDGRSECHRRLNSVELVRG